MAKDISDLANEDHFDRTYDAYHGHSHGCSGYGRSNNLNMWSKMPAPQFTQTQIAIKCGDQNDINEYLSKGYTYIVKLRDHTTTTPIIIFQLPRY